MLKTSFVSSFEQLAIKTAIKRINDAAAEIPMRPMLVRILGVNLANEKLFLMIDFLVLLILVQNVRISKTG